MFSVMLASKRAILCNLAAFALRVAAANLAADGAYAQSAYPDHRFASSCCSPGRRR